MNYKNKAISFAEKYGIVNYKVKGNKMTYKKNYQNEGEYVYEVNLDTMKETSRKI